MATDLNPLLGKVENNGLDETGKVSANEWNTLVGAVIENQSSVRTVSYNNGPKLRPDEDGNVNIVITENNYVLNVQTRVDGTMPYKIALGNIFNVYIDVSNVFMQGEEQIPVSTACKTQLYCNGFVVEEMSTYHGESYTINMGKYFTEGANTIKVVVDNGYGNIVESLTYEITAIYLEVALPGFAKDQVKTATQIGDTTGWELPVRIIGSDASVYISIDGKPHKEGAQTAGSTVNYVIETALTHGVHTLEVYAVSATDNSIKTTPIKSEYIYSVDGNTATVIAVDFDEEAAYKMYTVLSVPYWVFIPEQNDQADVTVQLLTSDDEVLAESSYTFNFVNGVSGIQTYQLALSDEKYIGDRTLRISAGNRERDIKVLIVENDAQLQEVAGYDVYLTSAGRSNNDQNVRDWSYGAYKVTFPDTFEFADYASGWNKDADGNVALHVRKGKEVSLNYQPFAVNPAFGNGMDVDGTKTGLTVSIELATRNCVKRDASVIRCIHNGVGFEFLANAVKFASNSESLQANYKEDTHIRVDLVIEGEQTTYAYDDNGETKYSEEAKMLVYVDGVYQQMLLIGSNTSFKQLVPQDITIGSEYCDIDIYCIRVYRSALNKKAITDNYAFDTPKVDDKMAISLRNDIFDSKLEVSYAKLVTARPNLPIMLLGIETLPNSKTKIPIPTTTFTNPNNPDDYDAGAASFTSANDELGNQGTSSMNYPMPYRNLDQKFSSEKFNIGGQIYEKYRLYANMPAAKSFTYKKDYASSEMCNNAIMSMIYTDMGIGLKDTFPNVLTLAQKNLGTQYRQSLYALPFFIFQYWDNEYKPIGMFNFINNKSDEKYLGFTGNYTWKNSRAQCWEIRDNNVFWDTYYKAPYWDEATESVVNDVFTYYEGRYPKDSTYYDDYDFGQANLQTDIVGATDEVKDMLRLHNWLVDTNQLLATGKILEETYTDLNGNRFNYDTKEYRLAKFMTEQSEYLILDQWILYYIWRETFWMYDSGSKNLDIYTMDGVHWGCMVRDCDTAMGIDNEGRYVFPPYLEDTDYIVNNEFVFNKNSKPEGGSTVLNGQLGSIWVNVRDGYKDRIQSMFSTLNTNAAQTKFSYDQVIKMCEDHQGQWSEALYNYGQKQYCGGAPYSRWIASGLGDKKNQRRYWLYYAFRYRMSKYHAGPHRQILFRVYGSGADLNIKTYTQMYVAFGAGTQEYKTMTRYRCIDPEAGVIVKNQITSEAADQIQYVRDGDLITDLGNLYEYGDTLGYNLTNAVRLRFLRIGNHEKPNAFINTRLTSIDLTTCVSLELVDVTSCTGFGKGDGQNGVYTLDLSKQTVLHEFYAENATMTGVSFPETETLETIKLGTEIKRLRLVNLPGLKNFSMQGGLNLEAITIRNVPVIDTYNMVYEAWAGGDNKLKEVHIENVAWTDVTKDFVNYLHSINAVLTGTITIADSQVVTFEDKKKWMELWGQIDSDDNDLIIKYSTVNIQSLSISGETALYTLGEYPMELISQPTTGNNALSIVWSITANKYASIDQKTGTVTVHTLPSEGLEPTATVTCTVTKTNGGISSASVNVMFYKPDAKIGDYFYSDDTYSTVLNTQKEVIGIVIDVDDTGKHGYIVNLNDFQVVRLTSNSISDRVPDNRFYDVNLEENYTIDGLNTNINFTKDTIKSFVFNDDGTIKKYSSGAMSKDITDNTLLLRQSSKAYVESLGRMYPTTMEEFDQYVIDFPSDFENVCVPALTAILYEPETINTLNSKFSKGNWRMCDVRLGARLMYLKLTDHPAVVNGTLAATGPYQTPVLQERLATGRDKFFYFGKNLATFAQNIAVVETHSRHSSFKLVCKF